MLFINIVTFAERSLHSGKERRMEAIYWIVILVVLLVIEIVTLGLTTIWFAGGALIAFIAANLGASLPVQIIIFIVVSLALLFLTRPIAMKYLNKKRVKTNYEGVIGKVVKVTERIDNYNATGAAVCNGQEWTARAEVDNRIYEPGSMVKVVNVVGVKLIVTEYREEA